MKVMFLTAACCVLLSTLVIAQDASKDPPPTKDWMRRFEGAWTTVSRATADATTHKGSMISRALGDNWVINEFRVDMGGFAFQAQQTLGFNSERKVFTATWIDNTLDFKWNYEGELNVAKKQLTFVAEGPDPKGKGTKSRYRDIYEFRDEDLIATTSQMLGDDGNWKTFMTGQMMRVKGERKMAKANVCPILMFEGSAEKAMNLYVSIFPDSKIEQITKYGADEDGKVGSVKHATFRVAGAKLICIDSPSDHEFGFTPSVSLYVDCESQQQIETIFAELANSGKVLMPLGDDEFSTRFGWVTDRFGVSWQLNFGKRK